jgi:hypothetical protein
MFFLQNQWTLLVNAELMIVSYTYIFLNFFVDLFNKRFTYNTTVDAA